MLVTKNGIRVVSYVHTERGLFDFDDLAPEEQTRAATAIHSRFRFVSSSPNFLLGNRSFKATAKRPKSSAN